MVNMNLKNASLFLNLEAICSHEAYGLSPYYTVLQHKKQYACRIIVLLKHVERMNVDGKFKQNFSFKPPDRRNNLDVAM
jgi:hypothetical protein